MQKPEANYNMIDWWKKVVMRNYANFSGRARRSEYWWYTLANALLMIPFYALAAYGMVIENEGLMLVFTMLYVLIALAMIVPSLAVSCRRLHDINRSGWWYLIGLIPLIGGIILLIWFFTEGTRGSNNYGPDPKDLDAVEFDFERTALG